MTVHRLLSRHACLLAGFTGAAFLPVLERGLWAQTNPAPQSLPYARDFGTGTFTTLPPGLAAWGGLSGSSIDSATDAAASAPTSDAGVSAATAAQSTGGCYGFASAANARFYIQTSSNASAGANQLALALNTMGRVAMTLDYDIEVISAQPRTVGVLCQYRIGASGSWISLTPAAGMNPFSQAGGVTGVKTSPHILLPIAAENQPFVQIRWAFWRGPETGNSSGAAIDRIIVDGVTATTTLSAEISPAIVTESAGPNAATLTVTRSGDTGSALQVSLAIDDASEAAYDGPNPLEIPAGETSASFAIRAVDDDEFDGTQSVLLQVTAPAAISASASLSVLDDEDQYSPPSGYYQSASGLQGPALKAALKTIASPANYRVYTYANTYTPLRALWEDPNNSANLLTVYSGTSIAKSAAYYPGGPSPDTNWSREHIWPESFGLDPDNANPGSTGADAGPDFTDLFNLRPCLQTVNLARSNLYFDTTSPPATIPALAPQCSKDNNSWEPREVEKGGLSRTIFYMATRYDGTDTNTLDLNLANTPNTAAARFANLATLLRWNEDNPVTEEERQRNQTIYALYQRNRNPFIDHPEFIDRIWGNVRIEKLTAAVTEGGASDAYTIVLRSQPTADVTLMLASSSQNQIDLVPAGITFTPENWNQPQTISITAIDDVIHENTITVLIQHSVASSDTRYAALIPLDVRVTVEDDDPVIAPAALPIAYGGPWDSLPTGFLASGLGSPYVGSLGGDTSAGSAKFDSTDDLLIIRWNNAPALMSYRLKGNPSGGTVTNGTFVLQQSVDGVTFATVRTVANKDNTDQAFSDPLAASTRYVAFRYLEKVTGNMQLDKLTVTAASPYVTWAAGFGLYQGDAAANFDFEFDGYTNLVEYTFGSSPLANDSGAFRPTLEPIDEYARLTAIVRSNDPGLMVTVETTTDMANPASWTSIGVTAVAGVDQTGVPAGFTRVAFDVPLTGPSRFLRFRFVLN